LQIGKEFGERSPVDKLEFKGYRQRGQFSPVLVLGDAGQGFFAKKCSEPLLRIPGAPPSNPEPIPGI